MLKRYHEIAIIKDGNKVTGMLLHDTYTNITSPLSIDKCKILIGNGEVQYLELDKSYSIVVRYTDEEIDDMAKLAKTSRNNIAKAMNSIKTFQDYINKDIVFKQSHIEIALAGNCLAGALISSTSVPIIKGAHIITMGITGNKTVLKAFKQMYYDAIQLGIVPVKEPSKTDTDGFMTVTLPIFENGNNKTKYITFDDMFGRIGLVCNTNQYKSKYIDQNEMSSEAIGGIRGAAIKALKTNSNDRLKIYNYISKMTKETEAILGI
ncbi:MAG: hypothetical protein J6A59_13025 [Lachnospiraceae bacterium]|nr:hypothetical protein [Lachnospiraceae bacterium]